jgi:hypothetical protein
MTERIEQIIQEIHLKFQIAKEEIALLKNENTNLLNQIEHFKKENGLLLSTSKTKDETISSLFSELEDLKNHSNQPIIQSENKDALIEDLLKEIDDCINLLKK